METPKFSPPQHRIFSLQTVTHKLCFATAKQQRGIHLRAKGKLAGQFEQSKFVKYQVVFTGNFYGFFEQKKRNNKTDLYFEGRIQNFVFESIDGNVNDPKINRDEENIFIGYFKGIIEERKPEGSVFKHSIVKYSIFKQLVEVRSTLKLILPTFVRLQLKSITAISLEKSTATFSATMAISIQFVREILEIIYHPLNRHRKIVVDLNKDISIELPLAPGNYTDENNDINCKLTKRYVMQYKIRRTFNLSIDDHYGQFFTPFNLSYASMVITFQRLKLHNIHKSKSNPFDKIRQVTMRQPEDYVIIDFINLDLVDYLHEKLYTPYNDLLEVEDENKRKDLLLRRVTKINFSQKLQCGQYTMSTNYLSLFTYHSKTFKNSNTMNGNDCWFMGIADKNEDIKQASVLALNECYKKQRKIKLNNQKHNIKLFHFSNWKHVHVQIPIYKYWVLYVIQVFIPIIVLGTLSLFIFSQQNGMKSDGTSTLNARIINVASILIAYTALIPLIRARVPRATKVSFIYIVIYMAVTPHILALISSIQYKDTNNQNWKKIYLPFEDFLFVVSFTIVLLVVFLVLIVVARFVIASSILYQIKHMPPNDQFISFEEANLPIGVIDYFQNLYKKRKGQFILHEIDNIQKEEFGRRVDLDFH